MTAQQEVPLRAEYGLDAPGVIRGLVLGTGASLLAMLLMLWLATGPVHGTAAVVAGTAGVLAAVSALACGGEAVLMWRSSVSNKPKLFARELAALAVPDKAEALDLGPGTGQLLAVLARQLGPGGHVVGIDIWRTQDQSMNSKDRAETNMRAEGLADRVELVTGDFRSLPFADGRFDAVTATLAVHNVADSGGRAAVLRESVRVLRPGGRLLVIDFRHTAEYAAVLRSLSRVSDVQISSRRYQIYPPVRVVTATVS